MKKTTLIQCPLAFCLAAAFGGSALTAAEKSPSASYEKARLKNYAAQDAKALESEKLAAEGKYEQAIDLLRHEVVEELRLEVESVDSWRAKQRLAEYTAKLRDMQVAYGNAKLRAAETAYADGRYGDAVKMALDAKNICDELTAEANRIIVAANSRKNAEEFRDKVNPEKMDDKLVEREKQIKSYLAAARTLMKHRRYEAASVEIEKVYMLDPFNAEAAQLANEIYKEYYKTGVKRRRADNAGQMAYEAWQWVEPQFPREIHTGAKIENIIKSADDHGIQAKLDKIIFPKVQFENADIYAVIDYINKRSKVLDAIDKRGVLVDIESSAASDTQARNNENTGEENDPDNNSDGAKRKAGAVEKSNDAMVSLDVKNVSLRELLNYVCYLTGMTYSVLEDRIVFGAVGIFSAKRYEVAPGVIRLIYNYNKGADATKKSSGKNDDGDSGEDSETPSAPKINGLKPEELKKFLILYGVNFPDGSSISCRNTTLTMNNTDENHRKLSELLRELNEDKPMVQIEVKSIELSESDMEELGFNWALGTLSNTDIDSKGYYTYRGVTTGSNTNYDSQSGANKALSMLGSMLSGVDSRLISNLNIFPDLLGSFKPFGSDQQLSLSLTINALDRSDRTEMISAPKVLVNSGETAVVSMGKRYYFPTSWDELEIEIEDSDGDNGYAYTRTLPTPSFGESQLMGTKFTVTPQVQTDNRTIRLEINPEITSYVGKDEYYMDVLVYREGKLVEEESERGLAIWRPVIATRSLDLIVDVYHGETLVLGGLSDSISQSRLDKIPILGDIPFIGRLFQSHSETSTRRNMLIFVTAKLMNSSGVPIRKMDGSFGIPEMGR